MPTLDIEPQRFVACVVLAVPAASKAAAAAAADSAGNASKSLARGPTISTSKQQVQTV